jgi:hypothetical protein
MDEELICLDEGDGGQCDGPVEYRMALSGTGKSFPRCDRHWDKRLEKQEEINERYPTLPPADFDPAYAGERWEEDY